MKSRLLNQNDNGSLGKIRNFISGWWNKNKNDRIESANYNSILNSNGSINGNRDRSVSLSLSNYTELTPGVGSQNRKESTVSTVSTVASAGAGELFQYYSDTYQDIKDVIDKDPYLTEFCCKVQSFISCSFISAVSFFGMIYVLMNNLLPLDQRYHDFVNGLVDEDCIPDAKSFLETYCYPNTTDSDDGGGGRRLVELFEFAIKNNTDTCHHLIDKGCDMNSGETGLAFIVGILGVAGLVAFCCICFAPKCFEPKKTKKYSDGANCCSGLRNKYLLSDNSNAMLKYCDINLSNTSLNTAKQQLPRRMMFNLLAQPWGDRGPRLPGHIVDVIYDYSGKEKAIKNSDDNAIDNPDDGQADQQQLMMN